MNAAGDDSDRLESWKEIAGYLGREVRTVQLWEKSEALPVHRHQHARQGSVYAFRAELDAWRDARKNSPPPPVKPPGIPRLALGAWVAGVANLCAASIGAFALWKTRPPAGDIPSAVVVLPFLD